MDRITSYLLTLILKTLGRNSTACFYQDEPSKNMLSDVVITRENISQTQISFFSIIGKVFPFSDFPEKDAFP